MVSRAQSTVLTWDKIRSLASSSVSGTYTAIGTPLSYPTRILKIVNDSTEDVTISIDGTNTHDIVPAGGFTLYDCGINRGTSSPEMNVAQGTQLYAAGTAGTGTIYVVALYAYVQTQTIPGE